VFLFILGLILLVGGLVGLTKASSISDDQGRRWTKIAAWVCIPLAVLCVLGSTIRTVSTKNVGIEVVYGKTSGHLGAGLHVVAPWTSVTEMDAAIQTDTYAGGDSTTTDTNTAGGPCITVRIANQQTACVDLSIRWRINPDAADELYQNYRQFSNVQDSLVHRQIVVALNRQLADYNPLNTISVVTASANYAPTPPLSAVSAAVQKDMTKELGNQIEVLSVLVPIMHFDQATQDRLNKLQQQEAQTRIAIAAQQTNAAQAVANNDLTQNVDLSPAALESRCLSLLQEALGRGMNPQPAAFGCLGGTGSVIVNGK
jgi:hypothetical protein